MNFIQNQIQYLKESKRTQFSEVNAKEELPRTSYSRKFSDEDNNKGWKSFLDKDGNKYFIGNIPNSNDQYKVLSSSGEMVGSIAIDVQSDKITGYSFNDSIQVVDKYQRKGIATAMVDYVEQLYNKPYIPTHTARDGFKKVLNKRMIKESNSNKQWYHGTPDARSLSNGFLEKTITANYIPDPKALQENQANMNKARLAGNDTLYWELIDKVDDFKKNITIPKPIFVCSDYSVAKTYADAHRVIDYQGAVEKVLKVNVTVDKLVTINAHGDRFRFISVDKVRRGFINAGISAEKFDETLPKLQYPPNENGLKTDTIAVLGYWFKFDTIDVVGVLDSYHGGTIRSTVRMVLDHKNIKIIS